jgi:hypothetical protein
MNKILEQDLIDCPKWIKDVSNLDIVAKCINDNTTTFNDDLCVGKTYKITHIRMNTSWTYIYLENLDGCFNSVNFDFYLNGEKHDIYNDERCWSDALIRKHEALNEISRIEQIFDDERLTDAFKSPNLDENGYSEKCPVVWKDYGFGKDSNGILILNNNSTCINSNLYSLYLDESAIVYDLSHKRLMIYRPTENNHKIGLKGMGWVKAVKVSPAFAEKVSLVQLYFELMLKLGYTSTDEMI